MMPLRNARRPAATLSLSVTALLVATGWLAPVGWAVPAGATPVPLPAPIGLGLTVRHAGGVVATNTAAAPPIDLVAATAADPLWLDAASVDGLLATSGHTVTSELSINGDRVTWTLRETPPPPWLIVQPVLTPLDATVSLGALAAGDYELTAEFHRAGAPIGAAPMTFGTASFTVVPEPSAAWPLATCPAFLGGRRRR